jgi:acetoacetyl-CoA reductase
MSGLNGKVALVTGGTGGIGSAICLKLAQAGCKVVSTYMDEAQANEWKQKMAAAGFDMALVKCDVSNFDDCKAMGDKLNADFGGVDILVNNAGITKDGTFRKMSAGPVECRDERQSGLRVQRHQAVHRRHDEQGLGPRDQHLVDQRPEGPVRPDQLFAAAKAGMHGFTMSLAQETAKKGVTVNSISRVTSAPRWSWRFAEDVRNQIIAQIPIGRLGKPEEIAALVTFLASEDGAFITGANIAANGGQHMC